MQNLRVLHHIFHLVDGGGEDIGGDQFFDQFISIKFRGALTEHAIQFIFVSQARIDIVEALILVPIGIQGIAQLAEKFLCRRGDDYMLAVAGGVHTGGCKVKAAVAGAGGFLTGGEEGADGAGLGVHQCVEQGNLYALACSAAIAHPQCRQCRVADQQRGHHIDRRKTRAHRPTGRLAVEGQHTGVALGQEVDARPAVIGAVRAEGGHPNPDNIGFDGFDLLVVESQRAQRRLADIGNQHIGGIGNFCEYFAGLGLLQVEYDIPLAAIEAQVGPALGTAPGAKMPTFVAIVGFDANNIGAQITHDGGAVGPR